MDDLTHRRLMHNEELFREVNEQREQAQPDRQALRLVCECAGRDCNSRITVLPHEYQAVRQMPNWFIVVPGHEVADLERVVEERPEFTVVEKRAA
jgi:hypothetical protein